MLFSSKQNNSGSVLGFVLPVVFSSNGNTHGLRHFGVVCSSVQNGEGKQLGGASLRLHQGGDLRRDSWMLGGQVR